MDQLNRLERLERGDKLSTDDLTEILHELEDDDGSDLRTDSGI